jgi:hypothetical protein
MRFILLKAKHAGLLLASRMVKERSALKNMIITTDYFINHRRLSMRRSSHVSNAKNLFQVSSKAV